MAYLKEKNTKIKTLEDAKLYLLRSFNEAHRRICERSYPEEEIGSTTVLAGITLELESEVGRTPEFVFTCASVGDCKAFKLDIDTLKVTFTSFISSLLIFSLLISWNNHFNENIFVYIPVIHHHYY